MNKEMILKDIESKIDLITDNRKQKVIKTIISKKDWFKVISYDTFISILNDLGYSKEEYNNIYKRLII